MAVQRVSVSISGSVLQAEALDLIHDVLLLRVESPRLIGRGEQIAAAVIMPGSSEVTGNIVGIDGGLVRFETVPSHAVTPARRLAPRTSSASETIVGVYANTSAATSSAPSETPAAPPRSAYARPVPGALAGALSSPVRRPAPSPIPAGHPARGIAAEVMRVATGRNEVPQRVAMIDISADGAVLHGIEVGVGRKLAVTLWLPGGESLRVLAIAAQNSPAGLTVRFQFDNDLARQRLAAAIVPRALPIAI